jgi:hypothetical protein
MATIIFKLIPRSTKDFIKYLIRDVAGDSSSVLKYYPEAYGDESFAISKEPHYDNEGVSDGLNVPPRRFWVGYGSAFGDKGKEWYISKGKRDEIEC